MRLPSQQNRDINNFDEKHERINNEKVYGGNFLPPPPKSRKNFFVSPACYAFFVLRCLLYTTLCEELGACFWCLVVGKCFPRPSGRRLMPSSRTYRLPRRKKTVLGFFCCAHVTWFYSQRTNPSTRWILKIERAPCTLHTGCGQHFPSAQRAAYTLTVLKRKSIP